MMDVQADVQPSSRVRDKRFSRFVSVGLVHCRSCGRFCIHRQKIPVISDILPASQLADSSIREANAPMANEQ